MNMAHGQKHTVKNGFHIHNQQQSFFYESLITAMFSFQIPNLLYSLISSYQNKSWQLQVTVASYSRFSLRVCHSVSSFQLAT